jgi:hypothetical protein
MAAYLCLIPPGTQLTLAAIFSTWPFYWNNQELDNMHWSELVMLHHTLLSICSTHDHLTMQAWFGSAQPGSSQMTPHIYAQNWRKKIGCAFG